MTSKVRHYGIDISAETKNTAGNLLKLTDVFHSADEAVLSSLVRATGVKSCLVDRKMWKDPSSSWFGSNSILGVEEILLYDQLQELHWALWRVPTSDGYPRFEMRDGNLIDVDTQVILFCDNDAIGWLQKNGFESDAIAHSIKLRSVDSCRPEDSATVEQVETIVRTTAPISPSNDEPISALINRRHQELDEELKPLTSAFDLLVDEFIPESRLPSIHNSGTRRGFSTHMSPLARFSKCTAFCEGCRHDLIRAIRLLKDGLRFGKPSSVFIDPVDGEKTRRQAVQFANEESARSQDEFHERFIERKTTIMKMLKNIECKSTEEGSDALNATPTLVWEKCPKTGNIKVGDTDCKVAGVARYGNVEWAILHVLKESNGVDLRLEELARLVDFARAEVINDREESRFDQSQSHAGQRRRVTTHAKVGKIYTGLDDVDLREKFQAALRRLKGKAAAQWRKSWIHWSGDKVAMEHRARKSSSRTAPKKNQNHK